MPSVLAHHLRGSSTRAPVPAGFRENWNGSLRHKGSPIVLVAGKTQNQLDPEGSS